MNKIPKNIVFEWTVKDRDGDSLVSRESSKITEWILEDQKIRNELVRMYRDNHEGKINQDDEDDFIDDHSWDHARDCGYKIDVVVIWGTTEALIERRNGLKAQFEEELKFLPSAGKLKRINDQINDIDKKLMESK